MDMQTFAREFPWGEAERRRLVRLCASISGDTSAAEDLAQETLFEAWRNAHKLTDPAGADRWLAGVARNVCLRAGRRAGHRAAVDAAARNAAATGSPDQDDGGELELALDGALGLLPEATRVALLRRHVDGCSLGEIGAELGVSEDAVSMRLARAKAELRRVLAPELRGAGEHAWQQTRIWCGQCGSRRLLVRKPALANVISFRCPGCNPHSEAIGSEYRLENPVFGRALGDVVRPTAVIARAAAWSERYFAGGAGRDVDCTGCGRPVKLRRYQREIEAHGATLGAGLHASCMSCGEVVSTSLAGLALSQSAVRTFRRAHPRTAVRDVREVDAGGTPALVAEYGSVLSGATVAAVFARDTLALLTVA